MRTRRMVQKSRIRRVKRAPAWGMEVFRPRRGRPRRVWRVCVCVCGVNACDRERGAAQKMPLRVRYMSFMARCLLTPFFMSLLFDCQLLTCFQIGYYSACAVCFLLFVCLPVLARLRPRAARSVAPCRHAGRPRSTR